MSDSLWPPVPRVCSTSLCCASPLPCPAAVTRAHSDAGTAYAHQLAEWLEDNVLAPAPRAHPAPSALAASHYKYQPSCRVWTSSLKRTKLTVAHVANPCADTPRPRQHTPPAPLPAPLPAPAARFVLRVVLGRDSRLAHAPLTRGACVVALFCVVVVVPLPLACVPLRPPARCPRACPCPCPCSKVKFREWRALDEIYAGLYDGTLTLALRSTVEKS